MRVCLSLILFFASLAFAARWSTQDFEIFDIARALEKSEGANATFYSFLNVSSRANVDAISKAYRKRSLQLHPDKNRGVKGAQKRFERLGLIAKMLRTPEVRERYDHFYRNGFPKWKGTGYFYSRYRPGVGSVLLLLLFVVAGFHWIGMVISAQSHRARINGHIKDAHDVAGYPGISKRKRVTTETGRVFSVEPNGDVYLVQGPDEFLLSPEEVPAASLSRSLLVRIPKIIFRQTLGRFLISSEETADILDATAGSQRAPQKETIKSMEVSDDGELKTNKMFAGKKGGARRRN